MPNKLIEAALADWREALRRLDNATDGDRARLELDAERAGDLFQQLSSEHMMGRLDALHEAEGRRRDAVPSTPAFHQAAKDEMAIATEIWDSARVSDEETPRASPRTAEATSS